MNKKLNFIDIMIAKVNESMNRMYRSIPFESNKRKCNLFIHSLALHFVVGVNAYDETWGLSKILTIKTKRPSDLTSLISERADELSEERGHKIGKAGQDREKAEQEIRKDKTNK
ncbi:MAG: DUF2934 domain-containing protein [Ignavibacteriaceae bacterium]